MKQIDLAIIGSGPAGLGVAIECAHLGITNTMIFEKAQEPLATICKYYKDKKRVDKDYKGQIVNLEGNIAFCDGTKESTLEFFASLIEQHSCALSLQTEIESITQTTDAFLLHTTNNDSYQARFVAICIGKMGQPNKPSYSLPSSIRKYIHFNANSCVDGERVLVVGGGNSAVEYACMLAQTNAITLNYRKSHFTRINELNKQTLEQHFTNQSITPKLGIDITHLEEENGRPKVYFTNGEEESYDRIIYAIGGMAPTDFLKKCNLCLLEHDIPQTNHEYETSIKGIFVGGDLLFKNGGSIAAGLNHGFTIAKAIAKRLN